MIAYIFVNKNSRGLVIKQVDVYNIVKVKSSHREHWVMIKNENLTNYLHVILGKTYRDKTELNNDVWKLINTKCGIMIVGLE